MPTAPLRRQRGGRRLARGGVRGRVLCRRGLAQQGLSNLLTLLGPHPSTRDRAADLPLPLNRHQRRTVTRLLNEARQEPCSFRIPLWAPVLPRAVQFRKRPRQLWVRRPSRWRRTGTSLRWTGRPLSGCRIGEAANPPSCTLQFSTRRDVLFQLWSGR